MGYAVTLASDHFDPQEVEDKLGMGDVIGHCTHFQTPEFKPTFPRFLAYQRLLHMSRVMRRLEALHPDLVFSTQSSIHFLPDSKTFTLVYDLADFFVLHTSGQFVGDPLSSIAKMPYRALVGRYGRLFEKPTISKRLFLPLSSLLEYQLKLFGYPHTPLVFPPCDLIFKPGTKKKRVIVVTRVFPLKRLEEFIEVARRLPDYPFIIVGTDTSAETLASPNYLQKLLAEKPANLEYVETRIRHRPELLEESKVYFYTSIEPGINISAVQGLGAGCIPVTPRWGGGRK